MFCGLVGTNVISDNSINNNSLVCKLKFKKFSMLFTGDIEEVAEKAMLSMYEKESLVLKATVLKVAHHRIKNIIHKGISKIGKSKVCCNWSWKK